MRIYEVENFYQSLVLKRGQPQPQRYSDLVLDPRKLLAAGPMSIAGHQQQFRNKQAQLRKLLQEAASRECNGYSSDAWTWATIPAPG